MPTYCRRDELVAAMTVALLIQAESVNNALLDIIPGATWALLSKARRLRTLATKGEQGRGWAIATADAEAIARELGVSLLITRAGDQVRVCLLTPRTGRYNTPGGGPAGWEL